MVSRTATKVEIRVNPFRPNTAKGHPGPERHFGTPLSVPRSLRTSHPVLGCQVMPRDRGDPKLAQR